jgi:hypothetical protein
MFAMDVPRHDRSSPGAWPAMPPTLGFQAMKMCSRGLFAPAKTPPAELDRYFRAEEARWRKLIQDAGIKVE